MKSEKNDTYFLFENFWPKPTATVCAGSRLLALEET